MRKYRGRNKEYGFSVKEKMRKRREKEWIMRIKGEKDRKVLYEKKEKQKNSIEWVMRIKRRE